MIFIWVLQALACKMRYSLGVHYVVQGCGFVGQVLLGASCKGWV